MKWIRIGRLRLVFLSGNRTVLGPSMNCGSMRLSATRMEVMQEQGYQPHGWRWTSFGWSNSRLSSRDGHAVSATYVRLSHTSFFSTGVRSGRKTSVEGYQPHCEDCCSESTSEQCRVTGDAQHSSRKKGRFVVVRTYVRTYVVDSPSSSSPSSPAPALS